MARRHRRASRIRQLFGVKLDGKSQTRRLPEDAGRLLRRERDVFAERIDRVGEPLGSDLRHHLLADEVDVGATPARELRRQGMGAQEGRRHGHRASFGEPSGGPQHGALGLEVEAVTRLDLDGGDTLGAQCVEPGKGRSHQGFETGLACGAHRGEDAVSGLQQVFVARPLEARLELVGPLAPVDQVGVAVDETRRDPAALQVADDAGKRSRPPRKVRPAAAVRDSPVPDPQGAIVDGSVALLPWSPDGRPARVCPTCGLPLPMRYA